MAEARAKNFPEARRLFIKALALNPRHIPAIGGLAHAESLAGNLHSARNLYARALKVRVRLFCSGLCLWRLQYAISTDMARGAKVERCDLMSKSKCRWIQIMSGHCVRWPHWSAAASTQRLPRLTCAKLCRCSRPTRLLCGYCLRLIVSAANEVFLLLMSYVMCI